MLMATSQAACANACRPYGGTLPLQIQLRILLQIIGAVGEMHEQGIFHADLKLENVLVRASGSVAVTDFGLAVRGDAPLLAYKCGPLHLACCLLIR